EFGVVGLMDHGDTVIGGVSEHRLLTCAQHECVHLAAQFSGEGQRLPGDEPDAALLGFDQHQYRVTHASTPSLRRISTRAGTASGPSPTVVTRLGSAGGTRRPNTAVPAGSVAGSACSIGALLARIRPRRLG